MTTYNTTPAPLPAGVTLRIRRAAGGEWIPVKYLQQGGGYVQVECDGPLWVLAEHVHPEDWELLATLSELEERRN